MHALTRALRESVSGDPEDLDIEVRAHSRGESAAEPHRGTPMGGTGSMDGTGSIDDLLVERFFALDRVAVERGSDED